MEEKDQSLEPWEQRDESEAISKKMIAEDSTENVEKDQYVDSRSPLNPKLDRWEKIHT